VTKESHVKRRTAVRACETSLVADVPEQIDLERHRELTSLGFNRPVRYVLLTLLVAFVLLGLLNVFGQRSSTMTARSASADLELQAPSHLRGGLLFQARFTVRAHRKLDHAVLQLEPGWMENITINTIEPSPLAQTSRNGSLVLTLGPVDAGDHFTLYMDFQVNPVNVGRRSAGVILYDGDERLVHIDRKISVFP
jgi:hypothetical protein